MLETSENIENKTQNITIPDGFRVFKTFDDLNLINGWKALYNKGANYNLSYEWCKIWFKHFGMKAI